MKASLLAAQIIFLCILLLWATSYAYAHSLEELQEKFKKDGESVPEHLETITKMYERASANTSSIKERLHADQHQMLRQSMEARSKQKCVELIVKMRQIDREIEEAKRSGESDRLKKLQDASDRAHAITSVHCEKTR